MNLKVYRLRPEAKLPRRAYETDAGMDLFYCPNGEKRKIIDIEGLPISPKDSRLIPTGIKVEVPYGYMLEIKNKSGIAHKRQLITGACVVDPGYDGEIFVNLHNIGIRTQYLQPGDKIAQAVLIPIVHCGIEEVMQDDLNNNTMRGEGGFGSTGER
jgi:dUTP pyrophosphatase